MLDVRGIVRCIAQLRDLLENTHVRDEYHDLLDRERRAEEEFGRQGYLGAHWPSRHPLVAGLLAYERWMAGQAMEPAVPALASSAFKIFEFRHDWAGCERWLAPRLLGRDFQGTAFEFATAYHFSTKGHTVQYRSAQQPEGPDLLIRGAPDIYVECTVGSAVAGRLVPGDRAKQLAHTILRYLARQRVFRVVIIEVDGTFEARHEQEIAAQVRAHLSAPLPSRFEILDGKYHVLMHDGGSAAAPLTASKVAELQSGLFTFPAHWGEVRTPEGMVGAPGGFVVRGVAVGSRQQDSALSRLAHAVAEKSSQMIEGAPCLVAAGFGSPLLREQATMPQLFMALDQLSEDVFRNTSKISGVLYAFRTLERADVQSGLVGELPWDVGITYGLRTKNPSATTLPSTFRMS